MSGRNVQRDAYNFALAIPIYVNAGFGFVYEARVPDVADGVGFVASSKRGAV